MKQQIKQLARRVLGPERTKKLFGAARGVAGSLSETNVHQAELEKLAVDPTNPALHRAFAAYLRSRGRTVAALAELRTAKHLGLRDAALETEIRALAEQLPPTIGMNHNRYFRLQSLAEEIIAQLPSGSGSILDVGGGDGALAQFIPLQFDYCLAEPKTNGISGERLPFAAKSFDVVTSCHVLEHVPVEARETFLDMLASTARRSVVLLNPFANSRLDADARMAMLWDLTHAPWVQEHRDCGLPTAEELQRWAAARGWSLQIKPNGSIATSVAIVLLEHYAKLAGREHELPRITEFFNTLPFAAYESPEFSNALVAIIAVSASS